MLGGSQQPTDKQLKGFRDLMSWMRGKGVNTGNIRGHQQHISTSCPGRVLMARVRANNWGSGGTVTPIPGGGSGGGSSSSGKGMTSVRSVRSQQQAVNAAGYSPKLVVDGLWGPKTNAGVRWYQKKLGVSSDGLWGPKTEAAHKKKGGGSSGGSKVSVPSGSPLIRRGSKGSRVKSLQRALVAAGERLPRFGADGDFGAETESALRNFQRRKGLGVDGIYGPKSAAALRKSV